MLFQESSSSQIRYDGTPNVKSGQRVLIAFLNAQKETTFALKGCVRLTYLYLLYVLLKSNKNNKKYLHDSGVEIEVSSRWLGLLFKHNMAHNDNRA